MEVLTIKVLPHLPPLYAQDQEADPLVLCTFFPPDSTWTWYAFECDGVDILYGLVMGVEQELGSFLLSEVGQARGPLGLPLERDTMSSQRGFQRSERSIGSVQSVCHEDGVEEEVAVMRKMVVYLLVLLVVVYGLFLLMQTEGIGNSGQPGGAVNTAGRHLVRIGQLDPGQYASSQEYATWAYSTCSTAAMTELANYYGGSYRITDILAVESRIGEITPDHGLLEDAGIAHTMAHFGFKTSWGYARSLDQIVALANQGTPVMVAFPPSRYPGGHLLVVTGGDESRVSVADSSVYNVPSFSRTRFLALWAGFAAVVTPQGGK